MIIPIFVPHLGCPQQCVFCNQHAITGLKQAMPGVAEIRQHIETYLQGAAINQRIEIAFYGGSFTAIPMSFQLNYLELARHYLENGRVHALRLSTRPDAIDPAHLLRLKAYGVELIELGAQSFDDRVLYMSERGHSAAAIRDASAMIHDAGIDLGLQLMLGLPGDTPASDAIGITESIRLGAKTLRIYPTLVLKDTALAKLYKEGLYVPLTISEAVNRTATMIDLLFTHVPHAARPEKIKLIRVGLQESEALQDPEIVLAGPHHPAFRSLVETERFRRRLSKHPEQHQWRNQCLEIRIRPTEISHFAGYKRSNLIYLREDCGVSEIRIIPDPNMDAMQFDIRMRHAKKGLTSCS